MECAGEVLEVGAEVTGFRPGDRVAAHPSRHCLAEQVVAPASVTHLMPPGMDFATGAALTIGYGTAHHALTDRAGLRPGDTLLVLGAAGGVGLCAVELGHQLGATVIAAAGGPEKLALTRRYGADHTVDYRAEDLREAVRAATGGRGADVVFDAVGGDMTDRAMRCLAWDARLLIVGFAGGRIADIPSNHVLIKGAQVIGVAFGSLSRREPATAGRHIEAAMRLWRAGRIRPKIGLRLPFEEAIRGFQALAGREAVGKVVVEL
jgi:NADPH2:quinone reductase